MTKISVALYEQAEQAKQTAQQLSALGIAQNEISVLSGEGTPAQQGCWATPGPVRTSSAS
jgi:hypothetical protein